MERGWPIPPAAPRTATLVDMERTEAAEKRRVVVALAVNMVEQSCV